MFGAAIFGSRIGAQPKPQHLLVAQGELLFGLFQIRHLASAGALAVLLLAIGSCNVSAAAFDYAGRITGARASHQRDLERRLEELRDALPVGLGRRSQQPHQ
jgi:hypothetical protein